MDILGLLRLGYGPLDDFAKGPSYFTFRIRRLGAIHIRTKPSLKIEVSAWRNGKLMQHAVGLYYLRNR